MSVKISIFNLKQQKTTKNNKNNKKQQKIQQKQQKKECNFPANVCNPTKTTKTTKKKLLFLKRGERGHLEQEQKFEKKKFTQYDLFTIQKKNISEFQK